MEGIREIDTEIKSRGKYVQPTDRAASETLANLNLKKKKIQADKKMLLAGNGLITVLYGHILQKRGRRSFFVPFRLWRSAAFSLDSAWIGYTYSLSADSLGQF